MLRKYSCTAFRYRWLLLVGAGLLYALMAFLVVGFSDSACILDTANVPLEETIPLPDAFGPNRITQTFSPERGFAGVVLWLTAQSEADLSTIFIEDDSHTYAATFPVAQVTDRYLIDLEESVASPDEDWTLSIFGAGEGGVHRISADVAPADVDPRETFSINGDPVDAELALQLCYRGGSLGEAGAVTWRAVNEWWAPLELLLNRASQYKPVLFKKPFLLVFMAVGAAGMIQLFILQLGSEEDSQSWAQAGEKSIALLFILVLYLVSSGAIRQLSYLDHAFVARPTDEVPASSAEGELVVYDFLLGLAWGDAEVVTPPNHDEYVGVRWLGLGEQARPVLWMHAPSRASYAMEIPPRAMLSFAPAIDPQVWLPEFGDGVEFTVHVDDGQSQDVVYYQIVEAKNIPEDRRWHDAQVDLGIYGGRQVTLTFQTAPVQTTDWDWASWGAPVLLAPAP